MSSLAEMLFLQSQLGQSPVQKGANAGMDAAYQSLAMNEAQKKRAEGMAMMQMAQHLFRPEYGPGMRGTLAAIGGGIQPATESYFGNKDAAEAQNMELLQRQDKLNQHAEEMAFRDAQLSEQKRYHNAQLSQMAERARLQYGDAGLENVVNVQGMKERGDIPDDAVPLAALPKNVQLMYHKDMQAKANKGKSYENVINSLKEMQKLSDEYPDLDTDFTQLLLDPENVEKNKLITLTKLKGADKKTRSAIEKWTKLTSNLVTNKVLGISGNKGTDILKKNIMEGVPRYGQSKSARDYVIKSQLEEFEPLLEESRWAVRGIAGGYYVPPHLKQSEPEQLSGSNEAPQIQNDVSPQSSKKERIMNATSIEEIQKIMGKK